MPDEAYRLGMNAASITDNPFWTEYPNQSKLGHSDELNARAFVDGFCDQIRIKNHIEIKHLQLTGKPYA